MAVPKRKTSKSKQRSRRAANKWVPPQLQRDKESGALRYGHTVDPSSGRYADRQVITKVVKE